MPHLACATPSLCHHRITPLRVRLVLTCSASHGAHHTERITSITRLTHHKYHTERMTSMPRVRAPMDRVRGGIARVKGGIARVKGATRASTAQEETSHTVSASGIHESCLLHWHTRVTLCQPVTHISHDRDANAETIRPLDNTTCREEKRRE